MTTTHPGCIACKAMTPAQLSAADGVARHNMRATLAEVPRLVRTAQNMTDAGHWQASVSYLDEAIREIEAARYLALANIVPQVGAAS